MARTVISSLSVTFRASGAKNMVLHPVEEDALITASGRRVRSDVVRNRAMLLEAARTVFRRQGFNAQMDDIADEAGLGVGTLYRHFPTKDVLIDVIVEGHRRVFLDGALAVAGSPDPWAGLVAFFWQIAELQSLDKSFGDVVADAGRKVEFAAICREAVEIITPAVQLAQANGQMRPDISVRDAMIAVAMVGRMMRAGYEDGTGLWRRLLEVVIDGLSASP